MAEVPPFLSGFLGNSTVKTIFTWQVAASVLQALLSPFLNQLTQAVNREHPTALISPAEAADMVLRGWMDEAAGAHEAEASGVDGRRFRLMVDNTGEPPGITELLEMYRRGFIPWDAPEGQPSVLYGIKTSRVRNEWAEPLRHMQFAVPTPGDVVDAWVENQVDPATAQELLSKAGVDPAYHQLMHDTRGRPPGPEQLGQMVHRGIIPETGTGADATTFEQGVAESAVKDKWTDKLFQLQAYLPPPRTITAMLREGALTTQQASQLLKAHGLSADLAAAYVAAATTTKVAHHKNLAESTVVKLYTDHAISPTEAAGYLADLSYTPSEAAFILEVADLARYERYLAAAIERVRSLYAARRIDKPHASGALDHLQLPAPQRDQLLTLWDMERAASVRILSEAQVVDAWAEGVFTQPAAQHYLEQLGYSPHDAWVLLSVKHKGPLPAEPGVADFPSGNIT